MGLLQRLQFYLSSLKTTSKLGLFAIVIIAITLPATVIISGQQQEIRQRAATELGGTCKVKGDFCTEFPNNCCTGLYCKNNGMNPATCEEDTTTPFFGNLSASLNLSTATFNFSYSGTTPSQGYKIEASNNSSIIPMVSFGSGMSSPITIPISSVNPSGLSLIDYSCGQTIYWRVVTNVSLLETTSSAIQNATVTCPTFTNLSAEVTMESAIFSFAYSGTSSSFRVDLSSSSDFSSDILVGAASGTGGTESIKRISADQTKLESYTSYTCGKQLYWRVYDISSTTEIKSAIQTFTLPACGSLTCASKSGICSTTTSCGTLNDLGNYLADCSSGQKCCRFAFTCSGTRSGKTITWNLTSLTSLPTTVTYSWTGTDGLTSTTPQVSKTYTTCGTKSARGGILLGDILKSFIGSPPCNVDIPASECGGVPTNTPTPMPESLTPVGYWKLDEGNGSQYIYNSGGGGFLEGYMGATNTIAADDASLQPATNPQCKKDGCLLTVTAANSGTGVGKFATVPDAAFLRPSSVSVSVWVKPYNVNLTTGMYAGFVKKDDDNLDAVLGDNGYVLDYYNGSIRFLVDTNNMVSGFEVQTTNRMDMASGTWYHLAGTYDATTGIGNLYINGSLVNNRSTYPPKTIYYGNNPSNATLQLGRINGSSKGTQFFNGFIDEVKVYNIALTADQVKNEYQSISSPAPTSTPAPTTPLATATSVPGSAVLGFNLNLMGLGEGGNTSPISSRKLNVQITGVSSALNEIKQLDLVYNSSTKTFKGTLDLGTTFPNGSYDIKVTTNKYLTKRIPTIVNISNTTVNVPSVTLVVGDANNDNSIDIQDYNLYNQCFNKPITTTVGGLSCSNADFNEDGKTDSTGSTGNMKDFALLIASFSIQKGD